MSKLLLSKLLCCVVFVSIMAMASVSLAGNLSTTKAVAIPIKLPFGGPSLVGPSSPPCPLGYDDILPTGTSFLALNSAAPGGGMYVEYADDIHLGIGGLLCEFSFTYFEPTPGTTDMIVTFYANDPSDGVLGAIVAGPYLLPSLPSGLVTATIPVPSGPIIPADVWFSISGTTLTHGLVIAGGPPTTGTSHDLFLHVPSLGLVFFGGSPAANFNISLSIDVTVPTEVTTWGQIKSIYE